VTDAPPSVRLPGGASGAAVWRRTLAELAQALDADAFERLLAGSVIVGYRAGVVEVRVATAAAADALSTGYRALVERHLNAQLRQPVAARFSAAPQPANVAAQALPGDDTPAPPSALLLVTQADLDLGRQLWRVALASLTADVPADEAQRLANVVVLGQSADEALLLAAPPPQSARLLERRRGAVERVLAELLGRRVVIRALGADAWIVGA
jgi:hypothetical protein